VTVVVDTGAGNGKDRPGQPLFAGLSTSYLANLARAGVQPEDVDVVINTHLHADHVGWNTRRDDGHLVPTFPNAQYVLPGPDMEYWDPAGGHLPRLAAANRNVFEDSVRPVIDSGQADIWSGTHQIGRRLTLHSAPGHTPGSSVLAVSCDGRTAVFTGARPFAAAGHRAVLGQLLRRGSARGRDVQAAGLVAGCRYRCPGLAGASAWCPRAADRTARGRVPDRAGSCPVPMAAGRRPKTRERRRRPGVPGI
jgi:metallo-beta-lactamase superfamily protein